MGKVSIIVTSYCHQNFIEQTMKSIFEQTYTDWEILIWDDSPDDATWNIIQYYIQEYPSKIKARHHSPSKHIVWNLNFLLSHTDPHSEYIAFLEWDDIWDQNYLLEKIKIFNQYPHVGLIYNDLSIINSTWDIIEENRINSRTRKRYKNETDSIGKLLLSDMICFSYSTLMSRKFDHITIHNRWKKDLLWSESDYRLQIANQYNIYGIEKPLTLYRKHWSNNSKDLDITIEHFRFLVKNYFSDWYIDELEYKKISILIGLMKFFHSLQNKKIKKAVLYFIDCLTISVIDTIVIWYNSFYYRLIKPYFLHLSKKLWRK
jgi:glycosyltransferase involved in cell wall biosynthesis